MAKNGTNPSLADALPRISAEEGPRLFAFLVLPRFNMMTLSTMIEVLRMANTAAGRPLYEWDLLAFDPSPVVASNGLPLHATAPPERLPRGAEIVLMGSWGAENYRGRDALAWLRRQARAGTRICAVEIGTYVAARAGVVGARRVTTHWSYGPGFREAFPDAAFAEQLFTTDGPLMTCGGGLAGVDLMLDVVAARQGAAFAAEVAEAMLWPGPRAATDPQRRPLSRRPDSLPQLVRDAVAIIEANVAAPVPIPQLAARLGVSQRQLERRFRHAVGCSVVQFGMLLRLQHARALLISTELGVREIATACGFNTLSHFIVSFRRFLGRRPSDYRQAWPEGEAAPAWPGTLQEVLSHRALAGQPRPS
jgi:transcriptional regulator GlxA family with amidase domain